METPEIQLSGAENTVTRESAQDTSITQNTQDPGDAVNTANNTENTESQGQGQDQEVEMGNTYDTAVIDGQTDTAPDPNAPNAQHTDPPTSAKKNAGLGFLNYLTSPIVEIVVDQGENETVLTAHQTLLLESPFLEGAVTKLNELGSRRIELPEENVDAFGCFLQFQYTHDYSSKLIESSDKPERDAGKTDASGEQLLKHARVYTLAEKLGIPALKTLAHVKIHRVNSTPRGELEYARYVYAHTLADDVTLRKPVASFWANRSHALRHEVEEEFKNLCLEAPAFCFDVLALVLDNKEKRGQDKTKTESGTRASGRKRHRGGQ